jgi:hypothetical protein
LVAVRCGEDDGPGERQRGRVEEQRLLPRKVAELRSIAHGVNRKRDSVGTGRHTRDDAGGEPLEWHLFGGAHRWLQHHEREGR